MQSKTQIKALFENRFNKEEFIRFTHNLLNELVPSSSFAPLRGTYVKAPFQSGIHEYERVCKYIDLNGKQIDVLIVKLRDKNKLENARTFQRNFVVDYLNGGRGGNLKDGALVAFYCDETPDWRFSFVKLEYELKTENGKIKEEKKMSSAKRYSFLVGQNENSHTAQSQLLPILEDDTHNPRLEDLEKVFSVETVTKEFFEKYKSLFNEVKECLDKILETDANVKKDFTDKDINTVDFAKKLLGQIVFLYFLQKKGWFGVEKGKTWGTGSKRFLRDLFDGKVIRYTNFFNEVLEPLFYEALATDRSTYDHFSSHFNSRIPFLNGGLFDPIGNYDWINTDIVIPNELFSNEYISQDKHKDIGTGILDVFDRYNFTVREDEPLEKEVAIDPEMLGKVFENMLEVKDRKSKGTYYTPREIVHYMCQESLINYLESNLENVAHDDIEYLIKKAELDKQKEEASELGTKKYSDTYPASIKSNYQNIDKLLADIKVCDPAIGSGAFPVGMMNEIVKARSNLNQFFTVQTQRTEYEFKRHAIAESLHGVDIDAGAVEIAKLRLWLSLIVDEDDIANIKPLPNLDYKIMQGNSLIEEYEGIKLFDDSLLQVTDIKEVEIESLKRKQTELQKMFFEFYNDSSKKLEADKVNQELTNIQKRLVMLSKPTTKESVQAELFMNRNEAKEKADKLLSLQKKFFESASKSEKTKLKNEIDNFIWELIEATVKQEVKPEKLNELSKLRKSNTKPFFLWKLNFADVFREKGGFDVVIGNPPYVRVQNIKHNEIDYYKLHYDSAYKRIDISTLFFEMAIRVLNKTGSISYITSSQFLKTEYGSKTREFIKGYLDRIIYFGDNQIFEGAINYISVFNLNINNKKESFQYADISTHKIKSLDNEIKLAIQDKLIKSLELTGWNLVNDSTSSLLSKLNANLSPLSLYANIEYGVVTGADKVFIIDRDLKSTIGESPFIYPILKPFNTSRYYISEPKLYIIYPYKLNEKDETVLVSENELLSTSPKLYDYILRHKDILSNRKDSRKSMVTSNDWFGLMRHSSFSKVCKPKILTQALCIKNEFCLDQDKLFFTGGSIYSITAKDNSSVSNYYLLGILNSKVAQFFYQITCPIRQNSYRFYSGAFLGRLPIPVCSNTRLEALVKEISGIPNQNNSLEKEIDQIIYKLYELTPEEINIVEEATKDI